MDELFAELKPDLEAMAEPLFDVSEGLVRKQGGFLPHGAVLEADGRVTLMMVSGNDIDAAVTQAEILPLLHESLRARALERDLAAVAVCEDVTITPAGERPTKAVKVLIEHRRGLTVAFYLPWRRRLLRGCVFGSSFAVPAQPEVRPWDDGASIA